MNNTLVIMLHDFEESSRRGMTICKKSRYLLNLSTIKRAINQALEKGVIFQSIGSGPHRQTNGIKVTQDDGGGSSLMLAEYLGGLGIVGQFFVPTKYIGEAGFLTKTDIRAIRSMGHYIGSHSHTHPNPFSRLNKEQIIEEVRISQNLLEDILGEYITTFSIPGGEMTSKTLMTLSNESLNLKEVYTSLPHKGIFRKILGVNYFGRYCVERTHSVEKILNILNGNGWRLNRYIYSTKRCVREVTYRLQELVKS